MEEEISLIELYEIVKKRISMIISLGLIGLIIAAGFTFFIATPEYESTTQLLVNHSSSETENIQLNDINTNIQMINTYRDIIEGPVILNAVQENLGTDLTTKELADMVEITTADNSQVFSLTITSENPFASAEIANEIATTFESEIGGILNVVDNVSIISEAVPNMTPTSPNNTLNLAIGIFLGLIAGIVVAFLAEFMDKTVRDERFITETLGWTNLGVISEMTHDELDAQEETTKQVSTRRAKSRV